ncbi:MAG TPA: hypothetical protein VGE40_14370, partial [Bacilli bacterium]
EKHGLDPVFHNYDAHKLVKIGKSKGPTKIGAALRIYVFSNTIPMRPNQKRHTINHFIQNVNELLS